MCRGESVCERERERERERVCERECVTRPASGLRERDAREMREGGTPAGVGERDFEWCVCVRERERDIQRE